MLIIFRIYFIETKLNFVFFDNKNVQGCQKIVGERDFHIQSSYTDQVQCLRHSRDQKFVTSLVQSAIVILSWAVLSIKLIVYNVLPVSSKYGKHWVV